VLSLPMFPELTGEQQRRVVTEVRRAARQARPGPRHGLAAATRAGRRRAMLPIRLPLQPRPPHPIPVCRAHSDDIEIGLRRHAPAFARGP